MSISDVTFLIGCIFFCIYGFYKADMFDNWFFEYSIFIGIGFIIISAILNITLYIKNKNKSKKD